MRTCTVCGILKEDDEFYWHKATNNYCSECKCCTRERSKKYRIEHPDKIRQMRQNYKERRKEIRYNTDRKTYLKHKYRINEEQYELMYNSRKGCCDICGKHVDYKKLCIDHNHTSNALRGLLCKDCNLGLGLFKDSIVYLQNAVKYLERYDTNEE